MDIAAIGAAKPACRPFALELYERYLAGETIENLSARLGIPPDRIGMRIRAAAAHTHAGSRPRRGQASPSRA